MEMTTLQRREAERAFWNSLRKGNLPKGYERVPPNKFSFGDIGVIRGIEVGLPIENPDHALVIVSWGVITEPRRGAPSSPVLRVLQDRVKAFAWDLSRLPEQDQFYEVGHSGGYTVQLGLYSAYFGLLPSVREGTGVALVHGERMHDTLEDALVYLRNKLGTKS